MNLTEQQKTDAAKALSVEVGWRTTHTNWLYVLEGLQHELAKVGLAIQPENKPKPLECWVAVWPNGSFGGAYTDEQKQCFLELNPHTDARFVHMREVTDPEAK